MQIVLNHPFALRQKFWFKGLDSKLLGIQTFTIQTVLQIDARSPVAV